MDRTWRLVGREKGSKEGLEMVRELWMSSVTRGDFRTEARTREEESGAGAETGRGSGWRLGRSSRRLPEPPPWGRPGSRRKHENDSEEALVSGERRVWLVRMSSSAESWKDWNDPEPSITEGAEHPRPQRCLGQWQRLLLQASIITTRLDLDLDLTVPGESSAACIDPVLSPKCHASALCPAKTQAVISKSAFLRAVYIHFPDTCCRAHARGMGRYSRKYQRMQAWSPAPFPRRLQRGRGFDRTSWTRRTSNRQMR